MEIIRNITTNQPITIFIRNSDPAEENDLLLLDGMINPDRGNGRLRQTQNLR